MAINSMHQYCEALRPTRIFPRKRCVLTKNRIVVFLFLFFGTGLPVLVNANPIGISWGVLKSCLEAETAEEVISFELFRNPLRNGWENTQIHLKNNLTAETVILSMSKEIIC